MATQQLGVAPVSAVDAATKAYVDVDVKVLVLATGAPVPGGTPSGTVIFRT